MTRTWMGAAALALLLAGGAGAEPPVPRQIHNTTALWFENWAGLGTGSLRVARPDGRIELVAGTGGTPVYRLTRPAPDGVYRFELRAKREPGPNRADGSARDEGLPPSRTDGLLALTGFFVVLGGAIVPHEEIPEDESDR